jgi:CheY-like chemotaxis protein
MTASGRDEGGPQFQSKGEARSREGNENRWRGRVLVVEPEHQIASTLQEMLSSDHDVEIETRPDDFLRRIERGDLFDVILCDLSMLERLGPDAWARLAAEHPGTAARIVFVTDGRVSEPPRAAVAPMSNLCLRWPLNVEGMRALVWRRTRVRLSNRGRADGG